MGMAEKIEGRHEPSEFIQALRASDSSTTNSENGKTGNGSLTSIKEDLESHSREWASVVKLLEQSRQQLEAAERERDEAYRSLSDLIPTVEQTFQELKAAMGSYQSGKAVADIEAIFDRNQAALGSLEQIAASLAAQHVWCREVWRQYAEVVGRAKKLRSALK